MPPLASALLLLVLTLVGCSRERPDLVLAGGRVVDPESGLDAVRWIAITDGRITRIAERPLGGRRVLDATGLMIAPGFIDLHAPAGDPSALAALALGGVTTALHLEPGVHPVESWYREHAARSAVHFGASVAYARARAQPFALQAGEGSARADHPLDGTAMEALVRELRAGLAEGALGFGVPLDQLPGATPEEIEDVFAAAGFDGAPVFVRPRDRSADALVVVLRAAGLLGTPLHIVDLMAWGGEDPAGALARIDSARTEGLDVTVDVRLTPRADAARRDVAVGLSHPGMILASDGGGGFLRALAPHLADPRALADVLSRVTLLPARRLEGMAPVLQEKGRIRPGAAADLVVLDPEPPAVRHVIVGGVPVVVWGAPVAGAVPGRRIRGRLVRGL